MGVFFDAINIIPLVRINRDLFGLITVDIQQLDPCLDALNSGVSTLIPTAWMDVDSRS